MISSATSSELAGVESSPASSEANWYALYTCSRHEKQVARQLETRGIDHFLPLYSSVRRWKDRRVRLDLPLFPGYLFVSIPLAQRLRVLTLPGSVGLVEANGQPVPLLHDDVERVRLGLGAGVKLEPHPFLTVGRRVRIRRGPFAGAEGVLIRAKGILRVVVSFDLIKQSMALEIDACDVEPILK